VTGVQTCALPILLTVGVRSSKSLSPCENAVPAEQNSSMKMSKAGVARREPRLGNEFEVTDSCVISFTSSRKYRLLSRRRFHKKEFRRRILLRSGTVMQGSCPQLPST